jgi:Pyridoxamine 5''-phosphate oxidase.
MDDYAAAMAVMAELFSKDCAFALATVSGNRPSVRMVDTYYEDGAFYVVTYGSSAKVKALKTNENAALCKQAYRFEGAARNIGHPLAPENSGIREKLIRAFEPWYFKHNDERDAAMCYIKIELQGGFFYKAGTGYKVDFMNNTVETFPFTFDVVLPE